MGMVAGTELKWQTLYAIAFLEGIFFRAGKLMFSSTKTTPQTATRPHEEGKPGLQP